MTDLIVPAILSSITAFAVVYAATPPLIRILAGRGMTVRDVNKKGNVMIPRPGGPSILAGIIAAEIILYGFLQMNGILAIMITTAAAFAIGYVDDMKRLGGWYKPVLLALAASPIILLGAYDSDLAFPLFGEVHIPILYIAVAALMISITGNTINSIDVLNGAASGFMIIASFSLTICLVIMQNYPVAVASLPLGFASLAFYRYHRLPSRIFPGDSGALTLGAMYGAIAIVGGVEVVAAVALLPAIANSFFFLSSVKRIVEHRQIKRPAVVSTEDFKLKATRDPKAPVFLVSLIISGGPMSERDVGIAIFKLALFAGILAVITAFMMGVGM